MADSTVNSINADAGRADTLQIRLISTDHSITKGITLLSGTVRLVLSCKVRCCSQVIRRPRIYDEKPRSWKSCTGILSRPMPC